MILGPSLGRLGQLIGGHPCISITFSTIIFITCLLSLIFNPLKMELDFENNYTDPKAPSISEMRAQVKFFGDAGKPWYMAIFARVATPGRSVTDSKEFNEIREFYKKIKTAPIRFDGGLNKTINYFDLCGETCNLNSLLFMTYDLSFFGIGYPVSSIFGYKSNIAKHFYEVTTDESGYIKQSNMTMLVFMAFSDDKIVRNDLKTFESKVQSYIDDHNRMINRTITFNVHGEKGMEDAVQDGMKKSMVYIVTGIVLSILLLFCILMAFGIVFDRFTFMKSIIIWVFALMVPVFTFITALAIYNVLGYAFNSISLLTPILTLIFAYDTIMMLSHTWLSDSELRRDSAKEHLLEVFATCMPSIIVTAAPALGFFICSFYNVPNYAALSVLIGLILVTTIFYTMFLFAPSLLFLAPAPPFLSLPDDLPAINREKTCFLYRTKRKYANQIASSNSLKIFALLLLLLAFGVPAYLGIRKMNTNLDYRQLLMPDSPKNLGVHYMSDIVWPQYFTILFIIESPPDFGNPEEYGEYKKMIAEIENIDGKLSNATDMTWINDFCSSTGTNPNDNYLNMTLFKGFISDSIYKAWRDGVKFSFNESEYATIHTMLHIVSFSGVQSLADKAHLFAKCREISSRYSQFQAKPFDTEIGIADVITEVSGVVLWIPLVALSSTLIVGVLIFRNFSIATINSLMAILLYIVTIAFPSIFGLSLNPFYATYLLFVAALAPKYTTHFCYYYQQVKKLNAKAVKKDRLHETLRKSFLPVSMSLFCAIAILLPALFCPVTIFREIAYIHFTMCISGFILSFFFLQICLNALPESLTGTHFLLTPTRQQL